MRIFNWFRKKYIPERVECDNDKIVRYVPDGSIESVEWSMLNEIRIITTDEGPWSEDIYWLFIGINESEGCAVSNSAEGFSKLFDYFENLSGFKDDIVVKAMGCTTNASFTVWEKKNT